MDAWIKYTLCFEAEIFNGKDMVELIHEGIGFTPKRIYASNAFRLYKLFEWKDLDTLAWEGYGVDFTLRATHKEGGDKDLRRFSILERGFEDGECAQMLHWILPAEQLSQVSVINRLLDHPRLKVAYCCDEEDNWMQNADSPAPYQVRGRSYAHLNVYWDEEWVRERIDISQNPGRSQFVEGYELSACWRMWFGPKFFGLVPKDKLLAFPDARRIETTEVGHVFIELYADPFEADLAENRRRQQAFRDWIDLDGLAERLEAEAEAEQ